MILSFIPICPIFSVEVCHDVRHFVISVRHFVFGVDFRVVSGVYDNALDYFFGFEGFPVGLDVLNCFNDF